MNLVDSEKYVNGFNRFAWKWIPFAMDNGNKTGPTKNMSLKKYLIIIFRSGTWRIILEKFNANPSQETANTAEDSTKNMQPMAGESKNK